MRPICACGWWGVGNHPNTTICGPPPASPPPAATAGACPHGWPAMSPTQTAPCLLCEVAALRAEVQEWKDATGKALAQADDLAAEVARLTARVTDRDDLYAACMDERDAARAALAALRERIEALAKEWEQEAHMRVRDADADPRSGHTLRLGASFERHHAERIRALSSVERGA